MTHEEHHRALVNQLASRLAPVRRLWPVGVRLALWLVLEAALLLWVMTHTRNDFMLKLGRPTYVLELLFFALAAVLSASLALRSAIPGRNIRPAEVRTTILLLAAGTVVVIAAQPIDTGGSLREFVGIGIGCVVSTCLLAALPLATLWWAVRRGASMQGGLSGVWVGAAALSFTFALMRIFCPLDEPLHLITWHLLPAVAVVALSALAGRAWLDFRSRLRHREPAT
jgi:hypothetical protein